MFCKSGKDRTAMQVTFKQAQFINRFLSTGDGLNNDCELDNKKVFQDATIMRVYGTRLPICDKVCVLLNSFLIHLSNNGCV